MSRCAGRPRRSSTVLSCHLVVVCEVSRRPADLREQFLFGFRCCRGQPNKLGIRCLFCLKTMNIFRIDYLISLSKLTLRFWYHFSLGGISLSMALSLPVLFPSFSFPFKFSFAIFFPLLCTPNFFYKSMLWFSFFFLKDLKQGLFFTPLFVWVFWDFSSKIYHFLNAQMRLREARASKHGLPASWKHTVSKIVMVWVLFSRPPSGLPPCKLHNRVWIV